MRESAGASCRRSFSGFKTAPGGHGKVHDSEEEMLAYASYNSNDHRGYCSDRGNYQIRVLIKVTYPIQSR